MGSRGGEIDARRGAEGTRCGHDVWYGDMEPEGCVGGPWRDLLAPALGLLVGLQKRLWGEGGGGGGARILELVVARVWRDVTFAGPMPAASCPLGCPSCPAWCRQPAQRVATERRTERAPVVRGGGHQLACRRRKS